MATLPLSTLGVGTHLITAIYTPDGNNLASTSAVFSQVVVGKAATTTTLASGPNPSYVGQPVTFIATVSPAAATGSVTFMQGHTMLGSAPVSSGVATFTTTSLPAGSLTIIAVYSGDAQFTGSTSAKLTQTVNKGTTTTTVGATLSGGIATFKATVVGTPTYGGTPDGTVTFMAGNTSVGTGTLNGSGIATLTVGLGVGKYNVKAVYAG